MSESTDLYRAAGVDIRAGDRAKRRIGELVRGTWTGASLGAIGAFGGMVRLPVDIPDAVLVASTDSLGTKVMVAKLAGRHDTVGEDLVNHCVNDILVHGARPIGFLDCFSCGRLDADVLAAVIEGAARGCRAHDMPLLGGETAQLPDVYEPDDYDLSGTIIGVVSEAEAIHGDRVAAGDALVGYEASGFHTNGYTLVRRVVFDVMRLSLGDELPGTGRSVADVLLAVHRSYFAALWPVRHVVHALAHITGGGIPGNLNRVLPSSVDAVVEPSSWAVPAWCTAIQRGGGVEHEEMRRVFNLGIGMIAVCAPADVDAVRAAAKSAGVATWVIGRVARGCGAVRWEGESG
ncbi:MAG: phosphoribosylformylglycinamidine cyclo-ligase [Gemmatimonadetes bacterium GWC2_71_10]|nr:MAG: phosphoribosylformylglycinamidine cyclo-ligase [Gemmatimonadetes bacterium GWC2_71_10]